MELFLAITAIGLAIVAIVQSSALRGRILLLEIGLEKLNRPEPETAVTSSVCRHCGAPLESGSRFCGACGTSVSRRPSSGRPPNLLRRFLRSLRGRRMCPPQRLHFQCSRARPQVPKSHRGRWQLRVSLRPTRCWIASAGQRSGKR
jgi:hypothetical protein